MPRHVRRQGVSARFGSPEGFDDSAGLDGAGSSRGAGAEAAGADSAAAFLEAAGAGAPEAGAAAAPASEPAAPPVAASPDSADSEVMHAICASKDSCSRNGVSTVATSMVMAAPHSE